MKYFMKNREHPLISFFSHSHSHFQNVVSTCLKREQDSSLVFKDNSNHHNKVWNDNLSRRPFGLSYAIFTHTNQNICKWYLVFLLLMKAFLRNPHDNERMTNDSKFILKYISSHCYSLKMTWHIQRNLKRETV